MQAINVHQVSLANYNLIEASAGTGKTYSIALLTLRILLETDIKIHEILMVTFTKAAVAELQLRIRKFVLIASVIINEESIDDPNIEKIISNSIDKHGIDTIKQRIKNAETLLDELAVMTIHSFCQQTLTEFAFESNQMFGAEMTTDYSMIIKTFVHQYWRNYITNLPIEILKIINGAEFLISINDVIKNHLNGKPMKWYDSKEQYILPQIANIQDEEFNPVIIKRNILGHAIQTINQAINDYKQKHNILGYNDLIIQLSNALKGANKEKLVAALQNKYKAVFVDEFQDTDKEQYNIFKTAFSSNTIVFLIGDPKQSIYAFRQADLYVYFEAKKDAMPYVFTMNTNYRSKPQIISALNQFFLPTPNFDTFHYQHLGLSLDYLPVLPKNEADIPSLYLNNAVNTPIDIFINKNITAIEQQVVDHVRSLLTNKENYFINDEQKQKILPQNIGIIVRSNKTGIQIKNSLHKHGIPAVMVDETKIFQTDTANELFYILKAIQQPNIAHLNRALLTEICNFDLQQLEQINVFENYAHFFQQALATWDQDGFYAVMIKFIAYFDIKNRIKNDDENKELRLYTNLIQLTEIVHKAQMHHHLNIDETIIWYDNLLNGKINADDEHLLRIEHDANAVQITTIHKSKGLEYDIVLLPEIDFEVNKRIFLNKSLISLNEINFNGESKYCSIETTELTEEESALFLEQTEQENRRLLYVAMTRAKHKIFMYSKALGVKKPTKITGLQAFSFALKKATYNQALIQIDSDLSLPIAGRYTPEDNNKPSIKIADEYITIPGNNWMKLSYSAIAQHPTPSPYDRLYDYPSPYDQFVFSNIRPGSYTGTAIHKLLERIDFQNNNYWQYLIDQLPPITYEQSDSTKENFIQLLDHICTTQINIANEKFSLNEVANSQKLNELEFYFPLSDFQINKLRQIDATYSNWNIKYLDQESIIGFMNGIIDLVFEHNNKYYILDWKTNFLGDQLNDYNENKVNEAMQANNYHLQYMVYITAMSKYLQQRIPDFNYNQHFGGVIYLFIRGIRKNNTTGIFAYKPSEELMLTFSAIFEGNKN